MGVKDLTHTTRAVLASLEQQRVRPATRDPWSYDRHDPATRAAEREGINHLRAVVPTLALSHGQRLHCHPPMAPRHHALRHALVADGTARPHVPTSWKSKGVGLELRYTRNEKAVRAAHLHGRCGATQGRGDRTVRPGKLKAGQAAHRERAARLKHEGRTARPSDGQALRCVASDEPASRRTLSPYTACWPEKRRHA
jgi:hypothetical protein